MNFFKVPLPRTEKEHNDFVDYLVKKYKFKNRDLVAITVCERTTHLPVTQAYTTYKYMADCVKRSEAYHTARNLGSLTMQHKNADR